MTRQGSQQLQGMLAACWSAVVCSCCGMPPCAVNGPILMGMGHCAQEFTLNTQLDLERQMASMQSRALVAEEQLHSLQHYIAQSTVAYQKEIMRLRALLDGSSPAATGGEGAAGDIATKLPMHRSGSAGDALARSKMGKAAQTIPLRPIRSATDRQGRLPRPLNQCPAVDAWHTQ